jgi:outer membrane protein
VKMLSSPIQIMSGAACALALLAGAASAQAPSDAKVIDLLAQAKAQMQGQAPAPGSPQAASVGTNSSLTMDEAVAKALGLNIDLAVARLNPQLQDLSIAQAWGVYKPTVNGTVITNNATTVPANLFQGGGSAITNHTINYNFGATEAVKKTGGTVTVNWTNSYLDSTNQQNTINPKYDTTLRATFAQPLWRNRAIDANRQSVLTAEINRRISDVSLRATTVNTVANTRNAYWDLLYAIQAVESAKTSLALAQKLVEDNKVKVEIGTLAPLDIVSAQAEAATRQQTLVNAEATRQSAELVLKRLIVSGTDDPIWNVRLNPTDRPATEVAAAIDLAGALKTALENRTDIVTARRNLDISNIGLKYQRNQTMPGIDLTAYYQAAGTGGTKVLPPPEVPGGYSDALSQLFKREQPTWNMQLTVSYPIGTSTQDASYARAKVQYQQSLAQLKSLELSVATDLTNQAQTVQSSFQSVQAATAALELSRKRLEAEQSKFDVGMSTNYNVVLAQRDFTDAEIARLRAILTYSKALVDWQRKQETSSSGGGSTVGGGSIGG